MNIVVLGSTGRIGEQALSLIKEYSQKFSLLGISGHDNTNKLDYQLKTFSPKYCVITGKADYKYLKNRYPNVIFSQGDSALEELVSHAECDFVIIAIVGVAALLPTIKAIQAKKCIGFASKEVLVAAGHLVMPLLKKYKTKMYPIDSEHAAVSLCLRGYTSKDIENIVITASGGPFLKRKDLKSVTVEEALAHPNWSMGKKITIDSATMINKGLEVIEAHWLFNIAYEKIKVLVHPQSQIHGMIELRNGAVIAQLSQPDMQMPILYAMCLGKIEVLNQKKLDLVKIACLTFSEPNLKKFSGLKLAYQVGRAGGSFPAVFNSANEAAVELFLKKRCSFLDISSLVHKTVDAHSFIENPSLAEILEVDCWSRAKVQELI